MKYLPDSSNYNKKPSMNSLGSLPESHSRHFVVVLFLYSAHLMSHHLLKRNFEGYLYVTFFLNIFGIQDGANFPHLIMAFPKTADLKARNHHSAGDINRQQILIIKFCLRPVKNID